jgi:hypothetical protein
MQIRESSKVYKEKVTLSEYEYENNPAIAKFKEKFEEGRRKRLIKEARELQF